TLRNVHLVSISRIAKPFLGVHGIPFHFFLQSAAKNQRDQNADRCGASIAAAAAETPSHQKSAERTIGRWYRRYFGIARRPTRLANSAMLTDRPPAQMRGSLVEFRQLWGRHQSPVHAKHVLRALGHETG